MFGRDFSFLCVGRLCLVVVPSPFDALDGRVSFFTGAAYVPTGGVRNFVGADKIKLHPGLAGIAAHQLALVIDGYTVFAFGENMVGVPVIFVGRLIHAGGIVIECQADGIKDGGLSCTGFSADEKDGFSGQWLLFEVNGSFFDGGQVMDGKFL